MLDLTYVDGQGAFTERVVEPYALINGREGWYVTAFDPAKDAMRHFRLDRIKAAEITDRVYEPRPELDPIADIEGWPRTGTVSDSRVAHVWISPAQARWAREERSVLAELEDGSIIVEWSFKGEGYLVKEILKEAGDAVVLEPADLREAVLTAAERLLRRRVSRRDQIVMSDEEALAFLDEQLIVTCASIGPDGRPHLMPLWYVVRDGTLWAWTYGKSQKVRQPAPRPARDTAGREPATAATTSCAAS